MPDWSYHPLKRLVLDRLRAKTSRELIHRSMSIIASVPGGRSLIAFLGHMKPSETIRREISQITFPSPVGLSGLIDPKLSGTQAFQELGLGFLEIGPIVFNEPSKQLEPQRTANHICFPNNEEKVPLRLAIRKLTNIEVHIPILARIDEQVAGEEWNIIVQHIAPFVDAFIITNKHFTEGLREIRPCYVSYSADEIEAKNGEIERLISLGLEGIVITAPHQIEAVYWHENEDAHEQLAKAVNKVRSAYPELTIISSGGVSIPDEGLELVEAGADLLLLTEGYVHSGPGLPKRIHERLLYEKEPEKTSKWSWSFLFGLGILFGGILVLYFALTSIILPYDESFIGLKKEEIHMINPLILSFMSHDRMALGGTMISAGILYIQLARHGIRNNLHWARITFHSAAIVGFLGIFLFIGFGYFDWLHGLFWLILFPFYYFSYREGKEVNGSPTSNHGKNDSAWKQGVYGQLMFVILGFSILIGGIVISTIGVTKVFVATDLSFICMTPQMLQSISDQLIPVIAHDRAGFGSALVSVGLLVLMLSLWGFRQGERWVWNTLAIGALPAFIAGIGTHIYIGYTSFLHLLPVYFLMIIYVLGLVFSYRFLKKK